MPVRWPRGQGLNSGEGGSNTLRRAIPGEGEARGLASMQPASLEGAQCSSYLATVI